MKWISCQRAVLGGKEDRIILGGEKVEHYFACKIMNKAYICEAPTDDGPPNDYIETTIFELARISFDGLLKREKLSVHAGFCTFGIRLYAVNSGRFQ